MALATLVLCAAVALPISIAPGTASELSAARKKVRVHTPPPAPVRVYRWRPADPSFDQHGRLYRPPPGLPCPIDLGYGRWTSCSYR